MKIRISFSKATLAVALAIFSSTAAMGQQAGTPQEQTKTQPETNWMKDFTSRIQFNGYAQGGFAWQDAYKNGQRQQENSFNLKRTLLWAKARITDRWSFLFMHDFSSVVQEFYTDYRITRNDALHIRVGQFKHSYSMENPLSPAALELVDVYSTAVLFLAGEGPDPLNGANYGRDLGAVMYGDIKNRLHYEFAVMNGQGINRRDRNNAKDIIGKIDVRPVDGLRVVLSGQLGRGNALDSAAWNPSVRKGENYRRNRYSFGAEYKTGQYAAGKYKEARPISLRAEWLGGKDGSVVSEGCYLTACVPLVKALDFVACGETYDRNKDQGGWRQTNATVGLQYWYYRKCRVQLQYTRCFCEKYLGKDYNWLQAQLQVAF